MGKKEVKREDNVVISAKGNHIAGQKRWGSGEGAGSVNNGGDFA